jgi:IS605 OrfB family transposase
VINNKPYWWNEKQEQLSGHIYLPSNRGIKNKVSWLKKERYDSNKHNQIVWKWIKPEREENQKKKSRSRSKKQKKDNQLLRYWRIKLKPDKFQKQKLQEWFKISNIIYNATIEFITNKKRRVNWTKLEKCGCIGIRNSVNKEDVRDYMLNEFFKSHHKKKYWKYLHNDKLCPRIIREQSIFKVVNAINSTIESLKSKGKSTKFKFKKRNLNSLRKSITLAQSSGGSVAIKWDNEGFNMCTSHKREIEVQEKRKKRKIMVPIFSKILIKKKRDIRKLNIDGQYNIKLKESDKFLYGTKSSFIISYVSPGNYYISIQTLKEKQEEIKPNKFISLDPGVKVFQTGIDDKCNITEYGTTDCISRICKLAKQCSKFQSKYDKTNNKKERKKYKKKKLMLYHRIDGLKKDMHWKVVREMIKNHEHIIIPIFGVKEMTTKTTRNIDRETTKRMLHWSHFEFRKKLKEKAEELGSVVHEVSEHYTSKACSSCGNIDWYLGSQRTYYCRKCEFKGNRDWQAAKNILLKNCFDIGFCCNILSEQNIRLSLC